MFGVPGGRHDTRSSGGLYEMHETLGFCLMSGGDKSPLSWDSLAHCRTVFLHDCLVVNGTSTFITSIPSRHGC